MQQTISEIFLNIPFSNVLKTVIENDSFLHTIRHSGGIEIETHYMSLDSNNYHFFSVKSGKARVSFFKTHEKPFETAVDLHVSPNQFIFAYNKIIRLMPIFVKNGFSVENTPTEEEDDTIWLDIKNINSPIDIDQIKIYFDTKNAVIGLFALQKL